MSMGWLTAVGVWAALALGGTPSGGGVIVGAQWRLGDSVTLGVTPVVVLDVPALLPATADTLTGITLGGAVLVVPARTMSEQWAAQYLGDSALLGSYLPEARAYYRNALQYEMGHVWGWSHFGVEYAARVAFDPSTYDPRGPLLMSRDSCWGDVARTSYRPVELSVRHYTMSWTFALGGE